MSETVDLYKILNVQRGCSPDEMKKSYKKLCVQHHPDKGGDENVFKKVSEAYNILKDPEKREIYDKYGIEGLKNGMAQNSPGDMQSMMENLFGFGFGGGRGGRNATPPPHFVRLMIPLEDIVNGNPSYTIALERKVLDRTKEKKECSLCKGNGFRMMDTQMGFMQMKQQVQCPQCKGQRFENVDALFLRVQENLQIPIPKYCSEDHKFVLKNKQDERVDGGECGDVVLEISYAEHAIFKRKGADLYYEIPLMFEEILTGFSANVTLLDKSVLHVEYPHLLKWNEVLCVPRKGLFHQQSQSYGDLYLVFKVTYPTKLDKDVLAHLGTKLDKGLTTQPREMVPKKMDVFQDGSSSKNDGDPRQAGRGAPRPPPQGMPMPFPMGGMMGAGRGGGGGPPATMECNQQ